MTFLNKKILLILALWGNLFFINNCNADSFIYPIAYDSKNNWIYIVHQKSIYELRLWIWDIENHIMQKALLSGYMPGGVKIIPSKQNLFSFIDQGRLRIKEIQKRSPKSIDFCTPICDMSVIEWKNEEECCFSARKNKNFIICKANIKNSKIKTIIEKKDADCIYPQIIDTEVFYVERLVENEDKKVNSSYKIVRKDLNANQEDVIVNNNDNSLAFLYMKSVDEGFYVEHPNTIDIQAKQMPFIYNYFYKSEGIWKNEQLFTFYLPVSLIFGNNSQRLYESILPFLPKINNNKIFFCDSKQKLKTDIYCYNIDTKKIEKNIEATNHDFLLAPLVVKNKCFYGFSINDYSFELDNDIDVNEVVLPSFKIS